MSEHSDNGGAGVVQSVNVGQPSTIPARQRNGQAKAVRTGIDKRPTAGPVRVGTLGLAGDHVLNKRHHGGPDQAVYLYTAEDYAHWATQLGWPLTPGQFGENLTVRGWLSAELRVGDRLHVGPVVLEVTAPRIPCATFAAHLNEPDFVKRFAAARRPGAYLRVIAEGEVQAGDPVTLEPAAPGAPGLAELFDLWYERHPSAASLTAYLEHPLGARLRAAVEERLAKLG